MEITEYRLILECRIEDGTEFTKELIYHGNENIIVKGSNFTMDIESKQAQIILPRHILEQFIEMIKL